MVLSDKGCQEHIFVDAFRENALFGTFKILPLPRVRYNAR